MKYPTSLLFLAMCFSSTLALIALEGMQELQNYEKQCVRLTGVSADHLQMAWLDRKIYEDEAQEKFAVCMLQKFRIMNMDGSINTDSVSYFLLTDNPASFETARDCAALAGSNVRETARKIMTCLLQTNIIVMNPPLPAQEFWLSNISSI